MSTKPIQPLAFFDLDDTILVGTNSLLLYVRYLVRKKEMPKRAVLKGVIYSALHKLSLINVEKLLDGFMQPYKGRTDADIWQMTADWFDRHVKKHIAREAVERIGWHKKLGHKVILLSSASQYVCEPVNKFLKMDDVLCTRAEVINGLLTGRLIKPLCYQAGKVLYAKNYADQNGGDLTQSYFYTDSYSDLPMLQNVGHPVCVNPDPLLRRHAGKVEWKIEMWQTPIGDLDFIPDVA